MTISARTPELKPVSVTIDEACKLSGLGRTSIYELINQRKLKSVTVGRRRLVIYASLETMLTQAAV